MSGRCTSSVLGWPGWSDFVHQLLQVVLLELDVLLIKLSLLRNIYILGGMLNLVPEVGTFFSFRETIV